VGVSTPPVILIAPSWGERNSLGYCGTGFIDWLLEAGYRVIIRPHPFSAKVEPLFFADLQQRFAVHPGISFDMAVSSAESLAAADLMISDTSGVRFDFAFLYNKPVITLQKEIDGMQQFEYSELDYVWEEDVATKLGPVVFPDAFLKLNKEEFLALIDQAITIDASHLRKLRDETVSNFGCAGEFIASWAIQKCKEISENKEQL